MEFKYKKETNINERIKISKNILEQERVPLVCEADPKSRLNIYGKTHFIVPYEMTVSQFTQILRKKIKIDSETSLFLTINGKISLTGNDMMFEIYNKYKDPEDNLLYIMYSTELIWG
ncbi:MAG: hypothetical protein MJ252_17815 [archaeon]|nr:hypothetical protein [archaeon]